MFVLQRQLEHCVRPRGNMTEELWHKMCTENSCGKSKTLNIKTNEKTRDDGVTTQ